MTYTPSAGRPPILRNLRILCGVTAAYDVTLGVVLLFFLPVVGKLLQVAPPNYPDNAQLNGAFLLVVGIGYGIVMRRLEDHLWYLWVMGVVLHGLGVYIIFSNIILPPHSPWQFAGFGVVDGVFGVLFLVNLTRLQKQGM